jgi:putative ABC transport system permease protein
MDINPDQYALLALRLNVADAQDAIDRFATAWKRLFPEKTFQYSFLDEQIRKEYTGIAEFGLTVQYFTGVAVIIACLGVYGLVLFVVQRKRKEIAVRKIHGASILNVAKHLTKEFLSINALSLAVAFPVSYYLGSQWLNNFAFRVDINIWPFIISFCLILGVTVATIGYQIIRAARISPVAILPSK